MTTHRLFFLGAGFSHLAGLPLGTELFQLVRSNIRNQYGVDNHVERDLKGFTKYLHECLGRRVSAEGVDFEEFLGFLDMEHYLGLRGKDTWSSEGNESQLMIRIGIAQVLSELTPRPPSIPEPYSKFARQLTSSDLIWTFNYDTLLERTLESEGIPYRLFPLRYSEAHTMGCTIDPASENELVILKLHGSVDWFSRAHFDEFEDRVREDPHMDPPGHRTSHPIFGHDAIVTPVSLVEGPRPKGESLEKLYRVRDLDRLLSQPFWKCSPFILAPSTAKLFYARPLIEFWNGLQNAGGLHLSLCFIGYSLPKYDDYATQAIYHVVRNYQYVEPNLTHNGRQKTKVRIVDFRQTAESKNELRDRYRFLDWTRTETRLDGFNNQSVDWVVR